MCHGAWVQRNGEQIDNWFARLSAQRWNENTILRAKIKSTSDEICRGDATKDIGKRVNYPCNKQAEGH